MNGQYNHIFGKWILVHNKLERVEGSFNGSVLKKSWQKALLNTPRKALIIGVRTLQGGTVEYGEDFTAFSRDTKQDIKALMVVESATRKPYYVPFEDYIKLVDMPKLL